MILTVRYIYILLLSHYEEGLEYIYEKEHSSIIELDTTGI